MRSPRGAVFSGEGIPPLVLYGGGARLTGLAVCRQLATVVLSRFIAPGNRRNFAVAGKCDVCGKTTQFGRNVSFSKRRTNRMFKPNVQSRTVMVDGVRRKLNVCTQCLRTMVKLS